ncbi:MAG: hypothetical protein LUH07_07455 [Lachnospiraceae bacterium]|nr:hypothetical protein [Lachnospiraceae bacterium]
MSTQSEKTGSEVMTDQDYERAKEMLKRFINEQEDRRSYLEMFMSATSYLMGLFKGRGSVPVSLLEYANNASLEKAKKRWNK